LQTLGKVAQATNRKLCVAGRSLDRIIGASKANGYLLDLPEIVSMDRAMDLPRGEVLIVATGGQGEPRAALARITTSTDYAALAAAQLVVEAATENYELKLKILKQAEAVLPPETLIASNTSSISITKMAAATGRPEKFIGMHFFNPVPMMALVEIIRGYLTSDATHDAVKALSVKLGKSPITVKNAPGFVVNRILVPMINEAFFVLAEGLATAEDIDAGMKLGCNQPIGPLALADMIGLDVCLAVMNVYLEEYGDSKYRPCPLLKEMVAAGRLGRKTGRGVYQY
jgi:3-hydroxybutyryl-CoA dehydrogenase